jgi:phenylacetate-coenzyme A ligase PaaK-like adenylate-forming protein
MPRLDTLDFVKSAVGCLYRERKRSHALTDRVRRERLARLLEHAKSSTPLGRDRLGKIDPRDPFALAGIKPITKDEIMSRFDDSVAHGELTIEEARAFTKSRERVGDLYKNQFMVATTSGTTGRVGYFVTDARSWASLNGALFARILRHRLIPSEVLRFCFGRRYRMAMTIATEGHFITRLVSMFRPLLTRAIVTMKAFSVMAPRPATIDALNRYQPHYLHSYPTYLESLAYAQLGGELSIDPEFISLGSEPVSQIARLAIRRAFPNAEVSETYGATECVAMANQCKHGRMHVNEDLCYLEPVDSQNHPVPVGVASDKVLLTNLVNYAQPLIRYELQDSIVLTGEECPCGSPMAVINIQGRSDDTFFFADASGRFQAHPPIPFETLFLDVAGLAQYQLIHEQQNHLVVRFVPDKGADPSSIVSHLGRRFADYFEKNLLGECVRVVVEPVGHLEREPGGHKLRQMYSKVPRPAIAA